MREQQSVHDFVRQRFIALREARGRSVRAFAKEIGVVPELLGRLERGTRDASLDTINRACDRLGMTLAEFFEETTLRTPTVATQTRRRVDRLLGSFDPKSHDTLVNALAQLLEAVKQGTKKERSRRTR